MDRYDAGNIKRRDDGLSPYVHTHTCTRTHAIYKKPLSGKIYTYSGKVRGLIDFRSGCASGDGGDGGGRGGNPSSHPFWKKKK